VVWRSWLRWTGVVLVLAAMGAGLYGASRVLLDPARFPLRHVQFEGELRNLTEPALQRLVRGYLGQSFFLLDLGAVYRVVEAEPWVEEVDVRRLWPDTIEVKLLERTTFGLWGDDEMVDVNGVRFQPGEAVLAHGTWPRLGGPDGHEMTLIQRYQEASELLGEIGLRVERLVENERRAWWMLLDNGITLNMGRKRFRERLQRFVDIYPNLTRHGVAIAVVDLRYANGFAVRWNVTPMDAAS
jgi:cell division protein FtsQ